MSNVKVENKTAFILPFDPDDDQTPGYDKDGTPWVACDPDTVIFLPDKDLRPRVVVGEIGFTGNIRMTSLDASTPLAIQPRRASIILGHDENTMDTHARPMRNAQFDQPEHTAPIFLAGEIIGTRMEERSLSGTALHEAHTMAEWPVVTSLDPLAAERQKGIKEGWFSPVTRDIYRHQRELLEEQEAARLAPKPIIADDGIEF